MLAGMAKTTKPAPDDSVQIPPEEYALLGEGDPQPRPYDDDSRQEDIVSALRAFAAGPDLPDAPATRAEQFQFLRDAHDGPPVWGALCLSLARQAPQLPPVYPSARAAADAVPVSQRITRVGALRRGMVAFFGSPTDSNPYDHVVTVAGWATPDPTDSLDDLLVWTNDALRPGGVDLVRASFFPEHWGDPLMFGSTSVNGYDLPGYDHGEARTPGHIGVRLDAAMRSIRRAIAHHRAHGHRRIVAALTRDLAELRETRTLFP